MTKRYLRSCLKESGWVLQNHWLERGLYQMLSPDWLVLIRMQSPDWMNLFRMRCLGWLVLTQMLCPDWLSLLQLLLPDWLTPIQIYPPMPQGVQCSRSRPIKRPFGFQIYIIEREPIWLQVVSNVDFRTPYIYIKETLLPNSKNMKLNNMSQMWSIDFLQIYIFYNYRLQIKRKKTSN